MIRKKTQAFAKTFAFYMQSSSSVSISLSIYKYIKKKKIYIYIYVHIYIYEVFIYLHICIYQCIYISGKNVTRKVLCKFLGRRKYRKQSLLQKMGGLFFSIIKDFVKILDNWDLMTTSINYYSSPTNI